QATAHAGSGSAAGGAAAPLTPAVTLTYSGIAPTVYGPDSSTAPTGVGTYTVTAHYAGDGNYNAKDSAAVALTITRIDPTVTAVRSEVRRVATAHGGRGSAS